MESACIRGIQRWQWKNSICEQNCRIVGWAENFYRKRPGEPNCTFADIQKIKTELNWVPTVAIEEGIKELVKNIDYWRKLHYDPRKN